MPQIYKSTNLQIIDNVSLGTLPIQNADKQECAPKSNSRGRDSYTGIVSSKDAPSSIRMHAGEYIVCRRLYVEICQAYCCW